MLGEADKLPEWAGFNLERTLVNERLIEITPTHFITQNGESKNSYHKRFYRMLEAEGTNVESEGSI